MIWYVIKRLLFGIPVLFIVSIIAFFLASTSPGDPVENRIALQYEQAHSQMSFLQRKAVYDRMARTMGKELPVFYFSITNAATPDTLYRIVRKAERRAARSLCRQMGSWDAVNSFRVSVYAFIDACNERDTQSNDAIAQAGRLAEYLLVAPEIERIDYSISSIRPLVPASSPADGALQDLIGAFHSMEATPRDVREWLPAVHFFGLRNQYHQWISAMLRGDFGVSMVDGRSASAKIREAIAWTLRLNIPVILLAFGISIPLGVATARRAGKRFDRITTSLLFVLYAIPAFWLATLAIVFLTTPEYAEWLDIFPSQGVSAYRWTEGVWEKAGILLGGLFLPVVCLLLGSLAYLTRQMRNGILGEMEKDYIRMARAKGLSEQRVYWHHAFRNALFPMITLVGSAIPAAISGSVIIEVLFNIPGMGRLMFESVLAQDWNVAFVMVLMVSFLTIIGYIISDVLYRWVNPQVRFNEKMI